MTINNKSCAKPLITLILVSYNQEHVVEEAMKSVFAQNYSPLEIILSDDCSTDGTFEIMQRISDDYDGPHKVRLNCNSSNMGIGKHWDFISRQACGELIVHAAGDDISVPSRVNVLVKAWMSIEPRPTMVSSDGMITTYDGACSATHRLAAI